MKEKCTNRGRTAAAPEGKRHKARDTAAKKQAHGETNGETLTDCKTLGAKYGLAAAECLARMNADALQREREAHAATAQEAASDVATLAQQVETAQMWQRYERHKRRRMLDRAMTLAYMMPRIPEPCDFSKATNAGVRKKPRKRSRAAFMGKIARDMLFDKWELYRMECKGKKNPTIKEFLEAHGSDILCGNKTVSDYVKTEADMRQFLKLHRQNLRNWDKREIDQKPKSGKR